MPLIQRLYDQYKAKGFDVLAIAMDGEPMKKSIQGLVRQQGYTFRVFIDKLAADESFVVADPYGVAGTPTLYLVDRAGKIALAEVGRTSREVLEAAIQKALEAK
jgi:alkyl hydroperoxide reductase subunit AhpC